MLLVCVIANWFARFLIHAIGDRALVKTGTVWGKQFVENKVLTRLSHMIPIVILATALPLILSDDINRWLFPLLDIYAIWIFLVVGYALVEVGGRLYTSREHTQDTAIEGILQATKLVLTMVAILLALSVIFAKSPLWFLSGLGAFMAIVLLIFRDSLLGLVAGLQLSVNDMVRVGDWIEIPGKGVDGDVIEVSLTTVRVSNWDRTIAMVPAYDLFQNSFINWRGMSDSGGRRIKRSINIDISTIQFATAEMLASWRKIRLLEPYLERKIQEIEAWNQENGVSEPGDINGRRQTNVGAFRAYIEAYLRSHPKIHQKDFTFLVRQLQPGSDGLPIEIYVFTNDNRWEPYEDIQSDIFDHLLAMVPKFDLEVHESPSGSDVRVAQNSAAAVATS